MRGPADLAGVDEPAVVHPALQRQQLGFGAGDEFGGAHGVAPPPYDAGDDDAAPPIGEGDVTGGAVRGGHGHPRRGRRGDEASRASAQVGSRCRRRGQDVIKPVSRNDFDVVDSDQAAIGDDTDPPHPEPFRQVPQHLGQGGDVGGVAGEHVMRDGRCRRWCTTGR